MAVGCKVLNLSLVVLFVVCNTVEGGCKYECSLEWVSGEGWKTVCRVRCTWGKRSIEDKKVEKPFPDRFSDYDLNGDGALTLEELAKLTHVQADSKATLEAFHLADKNDDGKIDCEEFKTAPYLFKHRPTC